MIGQYRPPGAPAGQVEGGIMPEVSALERLTAIAACEALMYEYADRIDHGAAASVCELFTADGEWTSPTIRAAGREGLRSFFGRREAMATRITRHVVTNIHITVTAPDRASARSVAIEYRDELGPDGLVTNSAPAIVGDYEDEFHRVDGTWLFHRRDTVVAFKRAGEEFIRPAATDVSAP
jgi:SnoaL-like domain